MQPKFKFGDKITIEHEFYGSIEGIVQDYDITTTGIWPFHKKHVLYRVFCTVYLDNDQYESTLITEEKYMKKRPEPLRSV